MIFAAVAGPTRGSSCNCSEVAVFRSITDAAEPEAAAAAAAGAVAADEPPASPSAADCPPRCGAGPAPAAGPTTTCSPSLTRLARFRLSSEVPGTGPPAAASASATREPAGSVTIPGCVTAPATWTTNVAEVVASTLGWLASNAVGKELGPCPDAIAGELTSIVPAAGCGRPRHIETPATASTNARNAATNSHGRALPGRAAAANCAKSSSPSSAPASSGCASRTGTPKAAARRRLAGG